MSLAKYDLICLLVPAFYLFVNRVLKQRRRKNMLDTYHFAQCSIPMQFKMQRSVPI